MQKNAKYILAVAFMVLVPTVASAASLSVTPASVSVATGDIITESIAVSSADQALNALSGTLSYPPDLLSVQSITHARSIITLWVAEPVVSQDGSIAWSGIVPNPGFTGKAGSVFSIQFRAKKSGAAHLAITNAEVLANDGNGTDIFTTASGARIAISTSTGAHAAFVATSTESAFANTVPPRPVVIIEAAPPQETVPRWLAFLAGLGVGLLVLLTFLDMRRRIYRPRPSVHLGQRHVHRRSRQ